MEQPKQAKYGHNVHTNLSCEGNNIIYRQSS